MTACARASLPPLRSAPERGVLDLFNRFIELQALGGIVPEGEEIQMAGLPPGLTCHHRGNVDDPDFTNVHLEIEGLAAATAGTSTPAP